MANSNLPGRLRKHWIASVLVLGVAVTALPLPARAGNGPTQLLCGTCGGESAPKVSLTSPINSATGAAPATFALAASVSASAAITSVDFLANGIEVDSDSTYPYTGAFTTSVPGTYSIVAVATDANGFTGQSAARSVSVTNAIPTITLTSPSVGSSVASPGTITLSANAADSDGSIVRVDFRSNGVVVCRDASAPYKCIYSGLTPGSYAISAVAIDNIGGAATSMTATATVTGVVPGRVSETRIYSYDGFQRLCKRFNPESGSTTVEYDSAGNVWRTIDSAFNNPTGCAVDTLDHAPLVRTYDALNRLIRTTTPWVLPDPPTDIVRAYYPDGAVKSISSLNSGNAWVSTNYTYNLRGLLTGETSINGGVQNALSYAYDPNGFQSALGYPDGQVVQFFPDGLGRSQKVASAAGAIYAKDIIYWPGGAIRGFTYGNGITHRMDQNARKLPARSYDLGPSLKVLDDRYDYDDNGNVVDITDAAQNGLTTRGMGYDGLDRLTAVVSPGQWGTAVYSYDSLDNITRADVGPRQYRYTYNPSTWRLDAIKSPAGATFFTMQYDSTGNQIKKNVQSYVFDLTNRLTSIVGVQSYRYDGLGRRVQTIDANGQATYWIYSQPGQVVFTSEARRSQNLSYVYLGNSQIATRSVAWGTGATAVRYQHTDALGSLVSESGQDGAVLKRNAFEPFGSAWGGGSIDGTGYTGHVTDQATGLVYMQQRYYDPQLSRFISVDSVGVNAPNFANFCRYCYAANRPFQFVDPDGRNVLSVLDWKDFAVDVGKVVVNDAVFVAAKLAGNEQVAGMAAQAASEGATDAALSTIGVVSPAPGTGRALKTAASVGRATAKAAEAAKLERRSAKIAGNLPKPPTGPGSAPKSERDPQRLFPVSERESKRAAQDNRCAHCGDPIDQTNSAGHHIERHADGGRTTPENHAEVCLTCHAELHSGGN
jgi:RHS repeat-associated protein